jgi:predicted DCC family thiol-disulfide oxidoreductase YuxK
LDLKKQNIIFFDGVCNLCDSFINFVISHDKNKHFKIASLQGQTAKKVIPVHLAESLSTVILYENEQFYERSTAALLVLKNLSHWSRILIIFIIVPSFLRDIVYDIVARYRYRFFGKKDSCRIPSVEEKSYFLD